MHLTIATLCPTPQQPSAPPSFFSNDTATTEIYTLSLHDALPTCTPRRTCCADAASTRGPACWSDRKSTRLNSSHVKISYAVFCLKKKKLSTARGSYPPTATRPRPLPAFQSFTRTSCRQTGPEPST